MNSACISEARITAAAIRLNTGALFIGPSTHFQAMEKIAREGYFDWPGITSPGTQDDIDTFNPYEALAKYAPEDGWMTSDDEFVNRAQAEDIARAAGQTTQYQGSLHSGSLNLPEAQSDDEFDDELGMKSSDMNVIAYPPGTKVRILTGKYAGEKGTVQNSTRTMTAHEGERAYWVHIDWDEDPRSAIVYRQEQLQRIIGEADDDDDLIKEVGAGYPRFEFEPFGSAYNRYTVLVNVGGEFIGSLVKTIGKTKDDVTWHIAFLGKRQLHTYIPVATPEEGAQKLWQDHTGLAELPIIKEPYVPLPPDPDNPNHYENLQATAKNLVRFLSETEDEKDFDEVKDYGYDQLEVVVQALEKAGFKIIESRKHENVLYVTFSWPYTSVTSFLSGWRRAKEVMTPYISLRQGNYVVDKSPQTKVATCYIIKRIEEDPNIWKVKPQMIARLGGRAPAANPVWFDIFFGGQKVGEAYLPAFSGSEDMAERLREEMAQLDQTVPFVPEQWSTEGNAFGSGPAIAWWRKNRSKLNDPEMNRHYFDRKLIGE